MVLLTVLVKEHSQPKRQTLAVAVRYFLKPKASPCLPLLAINCGVFEAKPPSQSASSPAKRARHNQTTRPYRYLGKNITTNNSNKTSTTAVCFLNNRKYVHNDKNARYDSRHIQPTPHAPHSTADTHFWRVLRCRSGYTPKTNKHNQLYYRKRFTWSALKFSENYMAEKHTPPTTRAIVSSCECNAGTVLMQLEDATAREVCTKN